MDREKALILVEAIITRYRDIDEETGTEIGRLIDKDILRPADDIYKKLELQMKEHNKAQLKRSEIEKDRMIQELEQIRDKAIGEIKSKYSTTPPKAGDHQAPHKEEQ